MYDFLIWKWFCGFNKNAGVASFMINSTWVTSWVTMKKAISRWWRVIYCKKIRKNLRKLEIETQEDFLGAKKKKNQWKIWYKMTQRPSIDRFCVHVCSIRDFEVVVLFGLCKLLYVFKKRIFWNQPVSAR